MQQLEKTSIDQLPGEQWPGILESIPPFPARADLLEAWK
jgi:hypothetical protein